MSTIGALHTTLPAVVGGSSTVSGPSPGGHDTVSVLMRIVSFLRVVLADVVMRVKPGLSVDSVTV